MPVMLLGQKSVTHPSELAALQHILVADPRELNAILDSRPLGVGVLHDGQLEPRPGPSGFVVAEALVMRLGEELQTLQSLDGRSVQRLRAAKRIRLDLNGKDKGKVTCGSPKPGCVLDIGTVCLDPLLLRCLIIRAPGIAKSSG